MNNFCVIPLAVTTLLLASCTADPPAPVPVPEKQSRVHCDLIFPAPLPPSEDEVLLP